MILIDWNNYEPLNEELIASLSHHALDRAIERGGEPIIWFRKEVEDLINKAEDKIQQLSDKYKTFVIKSKKGLVVVGGLLKKGKDLIFRVFTVHRKKNFISNNPNDAMITVTENISFKESYTPEEIKKVLWNTFKDKAKQIIHLGDHKFKITPEEYTTIDDMNEIGGELEESGLFDVIYNKNNFYITFLGENKMKKINKYVKLLEKLTNKKVVLKEEKSPVDLVYENILKELEKLKSRSRNPKDYETAIEIFKIDKLPIKFAIFKGIHSDYN